MECSGSTRRVAKAGRREAQAGASSQSMYLLRGAAVQRLQKTLCYDRRRHSSRQPAGAAAQMRGQTPFGV